MRLNALASFAVFGSLAVVGLAGCPIWDDGDGWNHDDDGTCVGDCCERDTCTPVCSAPSDCNSGEVCGADGVCHSGTCEQWGCPDGYLCDDFFSCIPDPNATGGGGAGGGGGGGGEGGEGGGINPDYVYCGHPGDCDASEYCNPDGICTTGLCNEDACIFGFHCDTTGEVPVCLSDDPLACGTDADCADGGASSDKCVGGICTPPDDQCFDQTQCVSGSVCADGKCTPSCADQAVCPSSYTCDATVELCTEPAVACTITNDCGGPDTVCVDGACVPRSIGGVCASGTVWVQNGCIPDQRPIFVCGTDGVQDVCANGSLCLHHSCYISCETPNETACDALPELDQCKDVTTSSGPHSVCGTADNLGNECDPTAGISCSPGLICVDGYCK